jgi:hypothetical protein
MRLAHFPSLDHRQDHEQRFDRRFHCTNGAKLVRSCSRRSVSTAASRGRGLGCERSAINFLGEQSAFVGVEEPSVNPIKKAARQSPVARLVWLLHRPSALDTPRGTGKFVALPPKRTSEPTRRQTPTSTQFFSNKTGY